MDTEIVVAVISAIATVGAVIVTNRMNNREIQHKIETHQAVTDTKLDNLTAEVKEHNNYARRMPVVEEQIKVINHRLEDLENENHRKTGKVG